MLIEVDWTDDGYYPGIFREKWNNSLVDANAAVGMCFRYLFNFNYGILYLHAQDDIDAFLQLHEKIFRMNEAAIERHAIEL